jgi:hypothetical protein
MLYMMWFSCGQPALFSHRINKDHYQYVATKNQALMTARAAGETDASIKFTFSDSSRRRFDKSRAKTSSTGGEARRLDLTARSAHRNNGVQWHVRQSDSS